MSRPLILHVGVQKTGTTSLQRFLEMRAADLSDCLVIRTPKEGTPMRPLGRAAVTYSLSGNKDHRQALRVAFDDVLDTLPEDGRTVLVSHENLAGAMPGNGGETRLFPAMPQMLKFVGKRAEERGFAPHVAFYTREMVDWRPSVWAQAVRSDGYAGTLDRFQTEVAAMPGWEDLSSRLRQVLGADRLSCFRLEAESDPSRPGRQLLELAGLTAARIDALAPLDGRGMERLNGGSIEFLRRLNGLSLNPHARDRVVDLVARTQFLFTADAPSEGTL